MKEGLTEDQRYAAADHADSGKVKAIKAALAESMGIRRIAGELKAGVDTVLRVKAEMAA